VQDHKADRVWDNVLSFPQHHPPGPEAREYPADGQDDSLCGGFSN